MGKQYTVAPLLLLACLAGCDNQDATPGATDNTSAAAAPAPTPPASNEDDGIVARYTCQADTDVAILENGAARVSLPGGERHALERVVGSDPEVYAGDSLYFRIDVGSAHLSQQDGARELACTKAGAPG